MVVLVLGYALLGWAKGRIIPVLLYYETFELWKRIEYFLSLLMDQCKNTD